MDWNSLSKRLFKFGAQFAAAIVAYSILRNTGIYDFTRPEIEGLNTLILLLGSIYAVTFAFAIFVIWGQIQRREKSSDAGMPLVELRFSRYLNADAAHAIRRTVTEYAKRALESEWDALSETSKK